MLDDPRIEIGDYGEVRLTNGRMAITIRDDDDTPGWWFLDSPDSDQIIHTDDPEMVALYWFCRSVANPPWVDCEIVSESTIRVIVADNAYDIGGDAPRGAQDNVLRFLIALAESLDDSDIQ